MPSFNQSEREKYRCDLIPSLTSQQVIDGLWDLDCKLRIGQTDLPCLEFWLGISIKSDKLQRMFVKHDEESIQGTVLEHAIYSIEDFFVNILPTS